MTSLFKELVCECCYCLMFLLLSTQKTPVNKKKNQPTQQQTTTRLPENTSARKNNKETIEIMTQKWRQKQKVEFQDNTKPNVHQLFRVQRAELDRGCCWHAAPWQPGGRKRKRERQRVKERECVCVCVCVCGLCCRTGVAWHSVS